MSFHVPDAPTLSAIVLPVLGALLLGWLVHAGLRRLGRHYRRHADQPLRARIALVVAPPASIAVPLSFLAVAVAATPLPEAWVGTIRHLLAIGVLLCLTWMAVRAVRAVERRVVREHPIDAADNLQARRVLTQTRVVSGVVQGAIVMVGVALALMTFPAIRQLGTTLLASAGDIGLVAGIAAKPVFGNLIAGLQIALAQPIRLDDVVIVEGEWGRIEDITLTYVVVRVWDLRRLVVPITYFIEQPFQNWTRSSADILGTVFLYVDYDVPLDALRAELTRLLEASRYWDRKVNLLQVTDAKEHTLEIRALASAADASLAWDLRCEIREKLVAFIQQNYPESLPRLRASLDARPLAIADGVEQLAPELGRGV